MESDLNFLEKEIKGSEEVTIANWGGKCYFDLVVLICNKYLHPREAIISLRLSKTLYGKLAVAAIVERVLFLRTLEEYNRQLELYCLSCDVKLADNRARGRHLEKHRNRPNMPVYKTTRNCKGCGLLIGRHMPHNCLLAKYRCQDDLLIRTYGRFESLCDAPFWYYQDPTSNTHKCKIRCVCCNYEFHWKMSDFDDVKCANCIATRQVHPPWLDPDWLIQEMKLIQEGKLAQDINEQVDRGNDQDK